MARDRAFLGSLLGVAILVMGWEVCCAQGTVQPPPSAQSAGGSAAVPPPPVLASKLRLLAGLVQGSPAAQRIDNSPQQEAKDLLRGARQSWEQARQALAEGRPADCERHINEGLRSFGAASRLVSDPGREEEVARKDYERLHERVQSFREAFGRVVAEKGGEVGKLLDGPRLDALVAQAETMARHHHFREARTVMSEAANQVETALTKARHRDTLIDPLQFASPHDEYAYESERNRSYEMMVNLALAERDVGAPTRTLIQRFMEHNQERRAAAQALAATGDLKGAIKALESGTEELVRALRLTGMAFM